MDFPAERDRAWQIWDRLAEWWDATIGDGNVTQDLVEPIIERLLEPAPGLRILDVACGAGRMARRLADRGAVITAVDASEGFLERARQRSAGYEDRITFSRVDATDVDSLVSLGERRFDAAVATFALMDMAEITPLATALARLLRPDGSFVLTITHPVFNSGDFRPAVESYEEGTEIKLRYAVSVADYLEPRVLPALAYPASQSRRSTSTVRSAGSCPCSSSRASSLMRSRSRPIPRSHRWPGRCRRHASATHPGT